MGFFMIVTCGKATPSFTEAVSSRWVRSAGEMGSGAGMKNGKAVDASFPSHQRQE
jgi:hypothetical protein